MAMGVGLGLGLTNGSGGPALPYAPVLIITGDSQALGTLSTSDQAAAVAAYSVTPKVKALNAAGAWVTYMPGTQTGLDFGGDKPNVGSEIGYISRFRAAYPNDTLYIIKDCAAGSYQTRGVSSESSTVSSTGNSNITINSGGLISNTLLVGTGIETGVYFPFAGFLSLVGVAGGRSGPAFSNVVAAEYNGTFSWSSTEGLTYNGNSGGITNGVRARIAAGLALLTNPRIVTWLHIIGTNDMSNTATGAAYGTDLAAFFTRIRSDFALTNAKIVTYRVGTGGTASTTVRAAQQARSDADADVFLVDTDGFTRWDSTHLDLAGHTSGGGTTYDITWNGALGI